MGNKSSKQNDNKGKSTVMGFPFQDTQEQHQQPQQQCQQQVNDHDSNEDTSKVKLPTLDASYIPDGNEEDLVGKARKGNEGVTMIGATLDCSGSMASDGKIEEARNGFNQYLDDLNGSVQCAEISVLLFDHKVYDAYEGPLQDARHLTKREYYPGGQTAYYDGLGATIKKLKQRIEAARPECVPETVIVICFTDGLENSSKHITAPKLHQAIEKLRSERGWEFIFMGASEESLKQARALGIKHYSNYGKGAKSQDRVRLKAAKKMQGGMVKEKAMQQAKEEDVQQVARPGASKQEEVANAFSAISVATTQIRNKENVDILGGGDEEEEE